MPTARRIVPAAVALANELNVNLVRRWVVEDEGNRQAMIAQPAPTSLAQPSPVFVPLEFAPTQESTDIRIELHRRTENATVSWLLSAAKACIAQA